ncbi:SBBP repeat-containing protein [Hymenobacter rubripertinctus]|uniref:T9SS C-terminal target domain-containing protein n=1 Tax=Hymenobacter rubripertinctus TaxID=2029981 RepID=A0A418QUI8_9BACT|nr:SBBP repeat-containing protein [Hymenobacter rubripertinctus]RIY08889.1 hypothetical protein D0T11_13260 [Hymenobacter rubripertinctus]
MKPFFLCLLLLSSAGAFGQAGYFWVNQLASSANSASANAVATDAAGNSYVTGSFSGTAQWGSLSLTSRGRTDLYVVKYSSAGKAQWVARLGNDLSAPDPYSANYARYTANGTAISLDGQGNVYIAGGFTGKVSGDSGGQLRSFSEDSFTTGLIAKLNGRGIFQWAQRFGGQQYACHAYDIATDAAGNSYLTGQSDDGRMEFGGAVVGNNSRRVLFVARYTTTGAVSWSQVSGNAIGYGASGSAVLLDKQGNCLVGGFFNHDMVLAGTSLTTPSADSYLASFEPRTGKLRWIQQGGGTGDKTISRLALDRQGNIYAAGHYGANTTLNGQALPAFGGNTDIFLARYSPGGTLQWVLPLGTSADEYPVGLATEADGTSTLLSTFYPPSASSQPQQTLLQTFRPDGSLYHTETLGTSGSCVVRHVTTLSQSGRLVLAGNLSGAAQFGSVTLQVPTGTAGFVASRRLHVTPASPSHYNQPALDVSPNPAHGYLMARLSWANPALVLAGQATLLTFMGKVVATQSLVTNGTAQVQAYFDCTSLPPGLYVLQLRTTDGLTHSQGVAIQ